jgi:hypothetical protein
MDVIKRDQSGHWHVEQEPKFRVGEVVKLVYGGHEFNGHYVAITNRSHGGDHTFYQFCKGEEGKWYSESCFRK